MCRSPFVPLGDDNTTKQHVAFDYITVNTLNAHHTNYKYTTPTTHKMWGVGSKGHRRDEYPEPRRGGSAFVRWMCRVAERCLAPPGVAGLMACGADKPLSVPHSTSVAASGRWMEDYRCRSVVRVTSSL